MMPLWTSAIRAASFDGEKCGCALCVAGAPCVAQRVWAMPVKPDSAVSRTCASSSATRETLRARFGPSAS